MLSGTAFNSNLSPKGSVEEKVSPAATSLFDV